jgi:putative FmdB family regulatory protein
MPFGIKNHRWKDSSEIPEDILHEKQNIQDFLDSLLKVFRIQRTACINQLRKMQMPTYEYECTDCGHRFTKFQNITESPVQTCPECSGSVRRLISGGAGVVFKGSGFHATDYRRGPGDSGPCCGESGGCDNPKRCCGQ